MSVPTTAIDLLFRPRTMSAAEALDLGLATEVVPREEFDERVTAVARSARGGTDPGVRRHPAGGGLSAGRPLTDALAFEAELMRQTGASEDHRSSVEAFLAKRRPTFTGAT